MSLAIGSRLGPYEILAPVGAGGMGEVFRARDTKLDRDVAIKVLPERVAGDPESLARFEREAKAVAALSHPNILAIYDFGSHEGTAYAVMELLEGETLRERLRAGELPVRKTIEQALQVAQGLAAAHEKRIVHRDLKPDNIFITRDGRVKILDFGLARRALAVGSDDNCPTETDHTEPGTVLGTVGYMSPEQVKGKPADHRSDIFSLGCVLYEMLSGRRAFKRETKAETMTAILSEDPPGIADSKPALSPVLDRIVRHCIEKNPEERFQSARDLAFDLETAASSSSRTPLTAISTSGKARRRFAYGGLALAALGLAFIAGRRSTGVGATSSSPTFKQLTFRKGTIRSARFAPDGQTIVYGAAWDGSPIRLFLTRLDGSESTPVSAPDAEVLSISGAGEMAVSVGHAFEWFLVGRGTLARMPLLGGAPRPVLEGVRAADWAPDGSGLAVVRRVGAKDRLEFPVGKVLYETEAWISQLRFSRRGDRIAFLDHRVFGNLQGSVALVDRAGNKTTLSGPGGKWGLAWSPNGSEVWFGGVAVGEGNALRAVDLAGGGRILLPSPGSLILLDVSPEGRALVATQEQAREILALAPGESRVRDLSWLSHPVARDISADGKTLLITARAVGGGPVVYLRRTDGSPPIRLGDGEASGLSPDGSWAVAIIQGAPSRVVLLPTGTGEAKTLPTEPLTVDVAKWLPDGKRLVLAAREPGHEPRLFLQDVGVGPPRPITPEGVEFFGPRLLTVSPDGKLVAAASTMGPIALYPVDGGEPREVPGLHPSDVVLGWTPDDRALFVTQREWPQTKIERLDLATGRREPWKELAVADPSGIAAGHINISADGNAYARTVSRILSNLFLIEGLR